MNVVTCWLFALAPVAAPAADPAPSKIDRTQTALILVVGAAGEPSYGKIFAEEVDLWRKTAAAGRVRLHVVGAEEAADEPGGEGAAADNPEASDKSRLLRLIDKEGFDTSAPLWLVLIGHGTFDGRNATFNLVGPDLASEVLAKAFAGIRRPVVVVNTTAASAPFLTALSAPGRVVVTATKTGQERNYARFGRFFARRAADPAADLDKDEQTSLFEAWLAAAGDTAEFYKSEGRIATEHPLLDDDGDGRGVRADFFEHGKLVKRPKGEAAADGDAARRLHLKESDADRSLTTVQREERDRLEAELAALRRRKTELAETEYFAELEQLLVPLARLTTGTPAAKRVIGK